jgi:hypothetical protein
VQGGNKFCYSLEIEFETRAQNNLIFIEKMSESETLPFLTAAYTTGDYKRAEYSSESFAASG